MSEEEPFQVVVTNIEEHEDGGATYTFELDDNAKDKMANLGLEFMLYCATYELDIQEALDHIALVGKSREKGDSHG